LLLLAAVAAPVSAQQRMRAAESAGLRKTPTSGEVATILKGAELVPGRTDGDWREVTIEGWVFTASTGTSTRDGFDIAITATGGENLRREANGSVIARLRTGAGLARLGSQGGWTHVRRTGWIPRKALEGATAPARAPAAAAQRPAPSEQRPAASAAQAPGNTPDGRAAVLRATSLAVTPDGEEAGTLKPGATAEVLSRNGDWVRVRLEGWMHAADLGPVATEARQGVSVAQVRADPARYIGQLLDWTVQFISIQTADELRPEIPVGRKYLLTRGPLPEPGFVYVVVTAEQLRRFEGAEPLEEFTLRGRLRATSTRYLPTPVLELVQVVEGEAAKGAER
jgi:hypothetical protein